MVKINTVVFRLKTTCILVGKVHPRTSNKGSEEKAEV